MFHACIQPRLTEQNILYRPRQCLVPIQIDARPVQSGFEVSLPHELEIRPDVRLQEKKAETHVALSAGSVCPYSTPVEPKFGGVPRRAGLCKVLVKVLADFGIC